MADELRNLVRGMAVASVLCLLASSALAADDEARGRELINSLGCKGCHQIDGAGGKLGPSLDGLGERYSKEEIEKHITEPKSFNPKSMMPSYGHLKEEDLEALVKFLDEKK